MGPPVTENEKGVKDKHYNREPAGDLFARSRDSGGVDPIPTASGVHKNGVPILCNRTFPSLISPCQLKGSRLRFLHRKRGDAHWVAGAAAGSLRSYHAHFTTKYHPHSPFFTDDVRGFIFFTMFRF
jgi:hypothetical protein